MSESGVVNIRGREYQTVAKRIADFRAQHPAWSILTEILDRNDEAVLVSACINDDQGRTLATGHAEESRSASSINRTSALENAETSAVGRALAFLGLGGTEIASADELTVALKQQAGSDIADRYARWGVALRDHIDDIYEFKTAASAVIANPDDDHLLTAAAELYLDLPEEAAKVLQMAPTKGGILTVQERNLIKTDQFFAKRQEVAARG